MGSDALIVGTLLHELLSRALCVSETTEIFLVDEEFRGFGRIDGVSSKGEAIIDVKASDMAAFERMIKVASKPDIEEPRYVSAGYVGRRNKSDRKRNKRDRWR